MKNTVIISAILLTGILCFSVPVIGQEEVQIKRTKSLEFDGESKKTEVIVKSTSEYNYLRLNLLCNLEDGDVTIEIIDPEGENQGSFTVKSDKTVTHGNKTIVKEYVSGSMSKAISLPMHGDWVIRAKPSAAKGVGQFNIMQGFEPKIDMIGVRNIKEK